MEGQFQVKWIYLVITILIVALILWRVIRSIVSGKSCCGTGGRVPAKVHARHDRISDYPYRYILNVEGMVCSACVRNVENTLNRIDGLWAKADLQKKEVTVLSKVPRDKKFFVDAYEDSTYTITGFKEVRNIEES